MPRDRRHRAAADRPICWPAYERRVSGGQHNQPTRALSAGRPRCWRGSARRSTQPIAAHVASRARGLPQHQVASPQRAVAFQNAEPSIRIRRVAPGNSVTVLLQCHANRLIWSAIDTIVCSCLSPMQTHLMRRHGRLVYSIGCRSMFGDLQLPAVRHEGQMAFYEELISVRRDRAAKALARRAPSELDVTIRPRDVAPAPAGPVYQRARSRGGWGWLRLRGRLRLWPRDAVSAAALSK
jgi:hypothetical protein